MDEQVQRMQRLIDVSHKLTLIPDLRSMLRLIISEAAELTRSVGASILEVEADEENLRFLASLPELKMLQTLAIPQDESIAGLAIQQKQTVMINNVGTAPFHYKSADELSGFHTRSVLASPILFRGDVLGVIEVINKTGGADYNGEDVTILETLATLTALALQNAHLQRLLESTRDEAQRLDKMKTDFVAITSHELRTPLGLILGHATFMRELADEDHQQQLDTIIKSAMRLKEIIESMATVDNVQSGVARVHRRTVSVRKLVLDALAAIRKEAEAQKITLSFDIEDADLMVEGDAEKIGTAILNLLKNGITFSNEGGYVYVTAEEVPGYVKVVIKDNGIGIPAKDRPHIFEQFYQVESHLTRKHGGMGLGLSVAKMNINLHGGRIWVDSVEGEGSTFTVLLPFDSDQAQAADKVFIS